MKRLILQGVNAVDKPQLRAQPFNHRLAPPAARLPGKEKSRPRYRSKESPHILNVLQGLSKARWALKDNDLCLKRFGKLSRSLPGRPHFVRRFEKAVVLLGIGRNFNTRLTVGGASRGVGKQLPSFKRKFKVSRGRLSPSQSGLKPGNFVEGLLNLHQLELAKVILHTDGKATTTDFDPWHFLIPYRLNYSLAGLQGEKCYPCARFKM